MSEADDIAFLRTYNDELTARGLEAHTIEQALRERLRRYEARLVESETLIRELGEALQAADALTHNDALVAYRAFIGEEK